MTDKKHGNWTLNGPQIQRGKSLNNSNKDKIEAGEDAKTTINKFAKGLLSYKLEIPRIVAMKR